MTLPFTPKFVDLVRNLSSTQGTGAFVLGAAVAGFTSFAAAVATGDRFYYCAQCIDKPGEREVGRGTMQANGTIAREPIGGAATQFTAGTKTVALIVAAEWFDETSELAAGQAPLFSEITTRSFPASVRRIECAGRTAVGQYPAAYIRDPDQSPYTVTGSELIAAAADAGAAQSAILAILNRIRMADASGVYWVIDDEGQAVNAGHFGAIADGSYDEATGAISGTDNAAAIQALIDWRAYLKRFTPSANRDCLLPAGLLRIGRGLQLGYGDTFRKIVLRGAGMSYVTLGGTTLLCDFDDQPGIVIQGGRLSGVEDLSLLSAGRAWILNRQIADHNNAALIDFGIDDRDIVSWHDPSQPKRAALLRFNPHAGIAVDPYLGAQPPSAAAWATGQAITIGDYRIANGKLYIAVKTGATAATGSGPFATTDVVSDNTVVWAHVGPASLSTSYPAAVPPAFLPAADRVTYGKGARSSIIPIRNVSIYGFAVGVVCQPCNDDGNGDFLSLSGCEIAFGPIGISIGNTQARNLDIHKSQGHHFHTAITSSTHGRQNGRLGGVFNDCSWFSGQQLFECNNSSFICGPTTFLQCYAEGLHRIGNVAAEGGTTSGAAMIFDGCRFEFNHQTGNGQRGVPAMLLGNRFQPSGAGSAAGSYVFRSSSFNLFRGAATLAIHAAQLDDCDFKPVDADPATRWQARARNTLGGGLVVPYFKAPNGHALRYVEWNETSIGQSRAARTGRTIKSSSRDYPASHYSFSLSPANGQTVEEIVNPRFAATVDKGYFLSGVSLAGRTLNFSINQSTNVVNSLGLVPGAVLWDDGCGMVFVVSARGGTSGAHSITAELQNGYSYAVDGTIRHEIAFSTSAGAFHAAAGGVFTPLYPLFADLTQDNATLANCRRADGWGGFITAGTDSAIQPGDTPLMDNFVDATLSEGLSVVSVGAGSITLNLGAWGSATKKRLPLWGRGL